MDRILNMVIRRVIGRLVGRGVDAGINRMTRGREDTTPEQQAQTRKTSKRARQGLRMARRIGRF
jgi:hypothetical protein